VAAVLFFHVAINIGMTVGLVPVIGIPLPLLSYGGTALITFTVLLFIMIRLDADRQMVLR
jgi:rod shape determining protein RodA